MKLHADYSQRVMIATNDLPFRFAYLNRSPLLV